MSIFKAPGEPTSLAGAGLLPRHPVFLSTDLEQVCGFLSGMFAPHRLTYQTRARSLAFQHRGAKLGAVELNVLGYGGEIMVTAPDLNYYLLQFMLEGGCQVTQQCYTYEMEPGTVAIINPSQPWTKIWSEAGRQLLIRIDQSLIEREFRAWSGRDLRERIAFDQRLVLPMRSAVALTQTAAMFCEALREGSETLDQPFVRSRAVAMLASALLVGLPHNHSDLLEGGAMSISPACVRRAERFMEDNAKNAISLSDVAAATGVSARALQLAFRRFRNSTPMARLRALRLELAREDLTRASPGCETVTAVAVTYGFGSLGRFAAGYKARFGESPSETLRRAGHKENGRSAGMRNPVRVPRS